MPIIAVTGHTTSGQGSCPVTEPAHAATGAQLLMRRLLAVRRRVTSVALAAAGSAATFAAAAASSGHLGRGAAAQIGFAATMIIFAMGEALLSPALSAIIDDRAPPGAAGRHNRLGTSALVTGCLLVLPAGGAALGASWGTSLLTTLAVASALASMAVQRRGRPPLPSGGCEPEASSPTGVSAPSGLNPASGPRWHPLFRRGHRPRCGDPGTARGPA